MQNEIRRFQKDKHGVIPVYMRFLERHPHRDRMQSMGVRGRGRGSEEGTDSGGRVSV